MLFRPILVLALSFGAVPVMAAETGWVELAPDVSMRLVSSDSVTDDGILWMGFEIDMPEGTKTYWRVPGESGIPMVLDDSASVGLGSVKAVWPFPKRETGNGYLDHSYYGWTLIPLSAPVEAETASISLKVTLGICSDICVPATARFDLPVDLAAPDQAHAFRIRQALAEVPEPTGAEDILGKAVLDVSGNVLHVERKASDFDPASMIAEIDGTMTVFDTPRLTDDGKMISFPVLGRVTPEMLADGLVRLSYDTGRGPYETTRPLTVD